MYVLKWWDKSGLPYKTGTGMCDIEQELECAIGGGEKARGRWRGKAIDSNANKNCQSEPQYFK